MKKIISNIFTFMIFIISLPILLIMTIVWILLPDDETTKYKLSLLEKSDKNEL